MPQFDEMIAKDRDDWERISRLERIEARNQRIAKRKEDNHRKFIIGEFFEKHIPIVSEIPVHSGKGSAAKNAVEFAPLEAFLSTLAADTELMAHLERELRQKPSLEDP